MRLFNKQKLNIRLNLLISSSLIFVLVVSGIYLVNSRKKQVFEETKSQIIQQIDELTMVYTLMIRNNQVKVNEALVLANEIFSNMGSIQEDPDNYLTIQAISMDIKKDKKIVQLKKWYQNNVLVQFNDDYVDEMTKLSNVSATIYQKIPEGYIRIATSVRNSKGERIIGTFIPNSSPVIETIERGLTFRDKSYIVDNWYLSAYQPLFIDGEIKGMLYVGVKEIDKTTLKDLFSINKIQDIAFPYLISRNGEYIIHPTKENKNIGQNRFFKQFKRSSSKVNIIEYKAGENDIQFDDNLTELKSGKLTGESSTKNNSETFYDFYKYEETAGNYIGITLREDLLYKRLIPFKNQIILTGFVIVVLMFFVVSIIITPLLRSINELVDKVGMMSEGESVDKIEKIVDNEIGNIAKSLNGLIDGMNQYTNFATKIGEGNLNIGFSALSSNDTLGNALIVMRDNLKKSEEERNRRQLEDQKQKWISDGISKFNEILRHHSQDLEKLSYNIVGNLTKYLNASVGGLFLIQESGNDYKQLELIASYAYDRERNLKKIIPAQTGLAGRCVQEKKILYFTEIPDDYIRITSGLGHKNPDHLIIIPLKDNEEVLGVIEIASFNPFTETEMDFIKSVSMSISKTLATTKINARTAKLLARSQQQSEELASQEEEMRQNLEELQATQEASLRRETELTGLLNALHTSTLVIEFDMDGNILNINDSFLTLMRLQREQLIGKNQDLLIPRKDIEEYTKIRERLNTGEIISKITHFTYLNMDLWLKETYTPINDEEGVPYKFIDIATDITENVYRQEQIEEQKNQIEKNTKRIEDDFEKIQQIKIELARNNAEKISILKALYESTLIAEYDTSGNLLEMNDRMLELFEVTKDMTIGASHKDFTAINETSRMYKLFWEDLRQGKIRTLEEHIKLQSGKRFWISQTFTPILDEENKVYKIINIALDITAKKIPNV